MNTFCSGFADDLEKFVQYRRASGSWNEYASHQNLVYFDHYCVDNYGGAPTLTQEMIDKAHEHGILCNVFFAEWRFFSRRIF